jgi:outer membrane biosynthesis protein TonB
MLGIRASYGALATLACGLVLAACGEEDGGSIPPAKANQWISQLEEIETAVSEGDCDAAEAEAEALAQDVSSGSVSDLDPAVQDALIEATDNLTRLAQEDCEPETGATGETDPITTEEATPPIEPPVEEEPPPVEPEEPPEQDQGSDEPPGNSGGGQGNGQGSGSGGVGSGG